MSIEIKVPALPESVADATVAKWYKKPGDAVERDENIVDLETDKVMLEVPAPQSGVLELIQAPEGTVVKSGDLIAVIKPGDVKAATVAAPSVASTTEQTSADLSPAIRRMIAENNVDVSKIKGSGKNGRIEKIDIDQYLAVTSTPVAELTTTVMGDRTEQRVPMSRLRAKVAERLVEVQQTAAILTTFNEINMKPVMDLRNKYKDIFEKQHKTRLGFMSFFVKAVVAALQKFPAVNASIDGSDILYHNYQDIGIAVGSPRGLVVPIIRNAEQCSMADVEKAIVDFGQRASEGKLTIEEMTGGTFTISNAGKFGSMMSTPIINPPQSAILGMHNIVDRPVAENGAVVIRPIMYVALSYDHRIIDGVEAVSFLMTIKQLIEDPARLLLEV